MSSENTTPGSPTRDLDQAATCIERALTILHGAWTKDTFDTAVSMLEEAHLIITTIAGAVRERAALAKERRIEPVK